MGSDSWLGTETGVYFSTFLFVTVYYPWRYTSYVLPRKNGELDTEKKKKKKKINRCEKTRHFIGQMICTEYLHKTYMHSSVEAIKKFIGPLVGDQTCSKYEEKICKANYYIKILQGTDLFHLKKYTHTNIQVCSMTAAHLLYLTNITSVKSCLLLKVGSLHPITFRKPVLEVNWLTACLWNILLYIFSELS